MLACTLLSTDPIQMTQTVQWLARQAAHSGIHKQRLLLAGISDALLAIAQALALAWLAHQLIIERAVTWQAVVLLTSLLLLRAGNSIWRALASAKVETMITQTLRNQLAHAVLHSHIGDMSPAAVSNSVLEQAQAVGRYHGNFAVQQRVAACAMLLFFAVAFYIDWIVALIFLLTAPLIPLFMVLVGSGAQQAADKRLATLDFLSGYFLDRLKGALTLRALRREDAETDAVDTANAMFRKSTMGVLKIAFLTSSVLELFSALAVALVAVYVGLHLLNLISIGPGARLDFRTGLFLLLLAPEFYAPLRQLAAAYHERASGLAAAKQLVGLLDKSAAQPATVVPLQHAPTITAQQMSYHHDNHLAPLWDQLSFTLPAGACLVIRGDSGTGKSTLLRLLAGLLQPAQGSITYQQPDALAQTPPLATGDYAWVSQTPWFIHGTVADNLIQIKPNASAGQLRQLLDRCGLQHVALDTPVDEQGSGLSGGEGRRLGIARAILSEAPVWFLDEPTAGLDAETEAAIVALIRRFKRQHTLIVATHSPQCATLADQTLWLGDSSTPQAHAHA